MESKADGINPSQKDKAPEQDAILYPASEDIYSQLEKEENINPEVITEREEIIKADKKGIANEKSYEEDVFGNDLDVPGSELDDDHEAIGSEDEENNYYSLGGDNHNDLEEDKGE